MTHVARQYPVIVDTGIILLQRRPFGSETVIINFKTTLAIGNHARILFLASSQ